MSSEIILLSLTPFFLLVGILCLCGCFWCGAWCYKDGKDSLLWACLRAVFSYRLSLCCRLRRRRRRGEEEDVPTVDATIPNYPPAFNQLNHNSPPAAISTSNENQQQQQQQRRRRHQQQQHEEVASVDSSLASNPPAYSKLFSNSPQQRGLVVVDQSRSTHMEPVANGEMVRALMPLSSEPPPYLSLSVGDNRLLQLNTYPNNHNINISKC